MRDLRLAVRALVSTPLVTAVVVLSLALGIGANSAVFSVLNGLLLRPLPVADPGSLVTISSDFALGHGLKAGAGWNYPMWQRLQERITLFGGALVWSSASLNLVDNGATQPANVMFVNGAFFTTLGVRARHGRTLTAADDDKGAPHGPVAVISDRLWRRRFGAQPSIIGSTINVEGTTFTVVGVTPPEFFGIEVGKTFDVALPMAAGPLVRGGPSLTGGRAFILIVMLRLKPGQSVEAATAAVRSIHQDLLGVAPDQMPTVSPAFLREPLVLLPAPTGVSDRGARAQLERPLLVMSMAMALVLFIGVLNLANLALSRAAGRRHEMGVRLALGASRWQMARRVLVESLLLSAASAVVGLLFAEWAGRALVAHLSSVNAGLYLHLPLDWRVLSFTAIVVFVVAAVFGVVPAYRAARVTPDLVRSQRSTSSEKRRLGVAGGFVLVQIALSLVLVAGTGLFARTFQRLAGVPLGFEPAPVVITELSAGRTTVPAEARLDLYGRILDRIAATPGVVAAASFLTPLGNGTRSALYDQPDRVPENPITPGWFSVYGTRLLKGRDFEPGDAAAGPPVAIVNESYVRKYFANQDPVGQPIDAQARTADARAVGSRTVVGVVADAAFGSVRQGARPTIYLPLSQSDVARQTSTIRISARSAGDVGALMRNIGDAVSGVDPNLTISTRRLTDDVMVSMAPERTLAALSSAIAVLALLLAGLGLYGVTANAVSTRRREMAIRMALGMVPSDGIRLVLLHLGTLVVVGTVAGVIVGLWLTRYLATMLYGLDPRDPVTFAGSAAVLAVVTLIAGWLPARQVSRIDPSELLRDS